MKTHHLGIKVTVTGLADDDLLPSLINEVSQELVSRPDFKDGTIKPGRVLDYDYQFVTSKAKLTVDVMRLTEDSETTFD